MKFKPGKEMRESVLKLTPRSHRVDVAGLSLQVLLISPASAFLFRMERLPGFRDFYPEPIPHQDVWSADLRQYIFTQWRETARRYGFRECDGPLRTLELYTAKSGDEIIDQLYNFTDKGDRSVALCPEMTPTLARLVAAPERQ